MKDGEPPARTVRILAIDGGGVRGLIPALILAEIEKRCGRPIWRLFDVVAGTSNGAVMTMLLTRPDPHPAADVVAIYSDHSREFFRRSLFHGVISLDGWLAPKYPARSIESTLKRFIGETAELKDALTEVVACAYLLQSRWPRVELLSRHAARSRPGCNFRMWETARASCAAPGYFPGPTITSTDGRRTIHPIDGGVYANDPSVVGLCHAISLEVDKASLLDGSVAHVLVSVGTGFHDEPSCPSGRAAGGCSAGPRACWTWSSRARPISPRARPGSSFTAREPSGSSGGSRSSSPAPPRWTTPARETSPS